MPEAVIEKVAVCLAVLVWLAGWMVIDGAHGCGSDAEGGDTAGDIVGGIADHDSELRSIVRGNLGWGRVAG